MILNEGLSVAIVAYNNNALLLDCVNSVFDVLEITNLEIIIFDNGDFEKVSSLDLGRFNGKIKIISSGRNIGFGSGINRCVESSKFENILIINPDAKVLKVDFKKILNLLDNNAGLVGGLCSDFRNRQKIISGSFPDTLKKIFLFKNRLQSAEVSHEKPECKVEYTEGSLYFCKKDVFNLVGGFDEDIFLYGEDYELCYRLMILGFDCFISNAVEYYHKGGYSHKREPNIVKGILYFNKKHKGNFNYFKIKTALIIRYLFLILLSFINRSYSSRRDSLIESLIVSLRGL